MDTYLRNLSNIVSSQVQEIETLLKKKKLTFPSPNEPFTPPSEAARQDPEILTAISNLAAAADQLSTITRQPHQPLLECATGFHLTSALGVALNSHIAEILREAGPQGLHVNDIAKKNGLSPQKLARVLRLLATRYIFIEVAPDVFANSRLSSMLDSLKPLEVIMEDPQNKFKGSPGLGALLETFVDEMYKGGSSMVEHLTNPSTAHSEEPNETAMNFHFKNNLNLFEWYELPGNEHRLQRFGLAMDAGRNAVPPELILQGLDWKAFSGKLLVDVGGGIGSTSNVLAENFPDLKIIVQDRDLVIQDAKKYWAEKNPKAIASGAVTLEVHDFFVDQPKRDVGAFLLRFVLHDWSDKYAQKILQALVPATSKATKLIIVDNIVPYACDPGNTFDNIPGSARPKVPSPLLPNQGIMSMAAYLTDMHMMVAFNGQERTVGQLSELLHSAGWKIESVFTAPGGTYGAVVAVPQ